MLQLKCIVLNLQFESVWPILPVKQCQWVVTKSKNYWTEKDKRFRFQSRIFWLERKKKRPSAASPKKRFDPLKNYDLKPLSIKGFAEAISKVSPQSILHTVVPKPKVHFVRELISTKIVQPKKVHSISDVIDMSKYMSDFKENLSFY